MTVNFLFVSFEVAEDMFEWTVIPFSVLVSAALAKPAVADARQLARAILLSIPIVVSRTHPMVRCR